MKEAHGFDAKKFVNLFMAGYVPTSPSGKRLVAKHVAQLEADRNGNKDDVFKATNIPEYDRVKGFHGYSRTGDVAVYESKITAELNEISQNALTAYIKKSGESISSHRRMAANAGEEGRATKNPMLKKHYGEIGVKFSKIADSRTAKRETAITKRDDKQPIEKAFSNGNISINGKEVDHSSIVVAGVNHKDSPDFSDAFVAHAQFKDGSNLKDHHLDHIQNKHPDIVNALAHKSVHEAKEYIANRIAESVHLQKDMIRKKKLPPKNPKAPATEEGAGDTKTPFAEDTLNEISKELAGRYADKAKADHDSLRTISAKHAIAAIFKNFDGKKLTRAEKAEHTKIAMDYQRKADKRRVGIDRANVKEKQEVEEGFLPSTNTLGSTTPKITEKPNTPKNISYMKKFASDASAVVKKYPIAIKENVIDQIIEQFDKETIDVVLQDGSEIEMSDIVAESLLKIYLQLSEENQPSFVETLSESIDGFDICFNILKEEGIEDANS